MQGLFHKSLALGSGVCNRVGKQPPCRAGRGCQNSHTFVQCGGGRSPMKLFFIRNDHLDSSGKVILSEATNVYGTPWFAAFVNDTSIRTLVLNRGAHWSPTRTVVAELSALLDAVAAVRPDVLVIVRDTPAGHPGCSSKPQPPLTSPPRHSLSWPHHWGEFADQNEAVAGVVRARPTVLLLAVEGMTAYRADSHPGGSDCLHYCVPGPVDAWVEALHRALWGAANLDTLRAWAHPG